MDKQVELFKSFMKASKGMKRLHEEEQQLQKDSQRNGQRVPLAKKKRHQVLQGKYLDALFDVTQEGEQLKEIKDVMDELQIITHINECQEEVIYKLRDILTPQETGKKSNNRRGTSLTRGDQEEEGFQDDSYEYAFEKSTAHQNPATKPKVDKGKSVAKDDQQEGRFQPGPRDLAAVEEMVLQSEARKEIINSLYKSAERAYDAVSTQIRSNRKDIKQL
jgi:hypothetical protein